VAAGKLPDVARHKPASVMRPSRRAGIIVIPEQRYSTGERLIVRD